MGKRLQDICGRADHTPQALPARQHCPTEFIWKTGGGDSLSPWGCVMCSWIGQQIVFGLRSLPRSPWTLLAHSRPSVLPLPLGHALMWPRHEMFCGRPVSSPGSVAWIPVGRGMSCTHVGGGAAGITGGCRDGTARGSPSQGAWAWA